MELTKDLRSAKIFFCQASYLYSLTPAYNYETVVSFGQLEIRTYLAHCGRLLSVCKYHTALRFRSLLDIVVYDRPDLTKRFSVVYVLLSPAHNARLFVRTQTNEILPLMSVTRLFQNANWLEREVWDMFGIFFFLHSDLRRLLTDYGFKGHPLRKDFPLSGYAELWYSNHIARILYLPNSFSQEFRMYENQSPWVSYFFTDKGGEYAVLEEEPLEAEAEIFATTDRFAKNND